MDAAQLADQAKLFPQLTFPHQILSELLFKFRQPSGQECSKSYLGYMARIKRTLVIHNWQGSCNSIVLTKVKDFLDGKVSPNQLKDSVKRTPFSYAMGI